MCLFCIFTEISKNRDEVRALHHYLFELKLIKWLWTLLFVTRRKHVNIVCFTIIHYSDIIMSTTASQITGVSSVYSIVCSGADQRKHQSSRSLAFVRRIHQWPVDSPHKGPVKRKIFPFDDAFMKFQRMQSIITSIPGCNSHQPYCWLASGAKLIFQWLIET